MTQLGLVSVVCFMHPNVENCSLHIYDIMTLQIMYHSCGSIISLKPPQCLNDLDQQQSWQQTGPAERHQRHKAEVTINKPRILVYTSSHVNC